MFDIHQSVYDRHGDRDEDRVYEYIDGLMKAFAEAPEAQPILEKEGELSWAGMMLEFYFDYIGGRFDKMSLRDVNEVLFELFPRKVSTEADSAPRIIAELRAFWAFVQRQYGLRSGEKILAALDDAAEARLRRELANPANYGMAKSFFMGGMAAGYDMHTQEGGDAYMRAYNASLLGGLPPLGPLPPPPADDWGWDERPAAPPSPLSWDEHKKKRKERKRKRQAKKRGRK